MNLKEKTIELVNGSNLSKQEIAERSGVSQRWLAYLVSEKDQDRQLAYDPMQRVHDYLSKQESK